MGDILLKAESPEQLESIVAELWGIANFTGGWVGSYGSRDRLRKLETRLIAPSATDEELVAIWKCVSAGATAEEAHQDVAGPSYRKCKWFRSLLRGTGGAGRDIDLVAESLVSSFAALKVRHLPADLQDADQPGWLFATEKMTYQAMVSSEDGNLPFWIVDPQRRALSRVCDVNEALRVLRRQLHIRASRRQTKA
jgi:hypothetical protein